MAWLIRIAIAWIILPLLAAGSGTGAPDLARDTDALVDLYEARDYFTLRERLGEVAENESVRIRVLRAAELNAFNDPERSNADLDLILGDASIPEPVRYEALRIRGRNLLRLHRYAEARAVFDALLESPPAVADSSELADFENMGRLTRALEDVPPQRVATRTAVSLPVEQGHIEVRIGDITRNYAIDTGANFSFLIESEAELLGLDVRSAGLEVESSTDLQVMADLAVADRVEMGGFEVQNVVFLVFPDEALTFPGVVIRGIIGFPVLEALGELRVRKDGHLEVPAEVPTREIRNLALDQLTPLIRVGYGDDQLIFRFDTGANITEFYEPFYRRYRDVIDNEGAADTLRTGGAGGIRELPGYRLEDVTLRIGGAVINLPRVHIHTRVLTSNPEDNDLYGNIGLDVLADFDGYILNFQSMSLVIQ